MKKSLFFAMATVLLTGCASDELVDTSIPNTGSSKSYISFTTNQKNTTRAQMLQNTGHYNFGVFAYKSTDAVNNIMDNYLVGYNDATNQKGYYMTVGNQTTLGDAAGEYNGQSMWAYEMLGSAEYDYTGPDGYYTKDQTAYMSNVANQYLRYWDKSADKTAFYAYAPYINGDATKTAAYTNSDHKLTIPNGSIVAAMVEGNDSPEACEYMVAATEVTSDNYGKDVALSFSRLNAKVNIKFWEDIQGYSVKILDLTSTYGVSAAPAIKGSTLSANTQGKYFKSSGVVVDYTNISAPTFAWSDAAVETSDALNFKSPTATQIGTSRVEATPSTSTYYAIPKNNTTGFTFHVSYELTSTTGERIVVRDATAFVPVEYTNWVKNTHYTYIFRITKDSNGYTEPEDPNNPIDPNDPKVDEEEALYPIIFDNCTVEEWIENTSDYDISEGADTRDYSVVLSAPTVKASTGGTVTIKLYEDNEDITAGKTFTLAGPDLTNVTLSGTTVTVATGAKTGVYTVSWQNTNADGSPAKTYSASFYVIGNYAVSTSTKYIGTNGKANTTLQASTTLAGAAETTLAGTFSLKFPATIPADKKSAVSISNTGLVTVTPKAFAGDYTVVYTTDEGDAEAVFTVVDYSFNLSTNNVGLSNSSQSVTVSGAAALPTSGTTSATSVYTISGPETTKVTIDAATGKVTVDPAATTGKYTVTRTVTIDGSETVYEQEFAVKDVYTLELSQTVVDNDDNVTITVTATKNGADNKADVTYPTATGLTVDATAGTIKVLDTCQPGVYEVKNGTETVTFEVKD